MLIINQGMELLFKFFWLVEKTLVKRQGEKKKTTPDLLPYISLPSQSLERRHSLQLFYKAYSFLPFHCLLN